MIPQIIHYCWFGRGVKSDLMLKCMDSWKKYCPEYQIIEWNEDNYDTASAPLFVRHALKKKAWAFATDYIRYDVVYRHGGIYLDTDVELVGSLDPFLDNTAYFGFQQKDEYSVASGLGFGAEKGEKFLLELMNVYKESAFIKNGTIDLHTNSSREKNVFLKHGLIENGKTQVLDNHVRIYAKEYFAPYNNMLGVMEQTDKTVSIHWYGVSWKESVEKLRKTKDKIQKFKRCFRFPAKLLKRLLGEARYQRIRVQFLNYLSRL